MKTTVLSLFDSPRRAIISNRLKKAGIEFNFYDAIQLNSSKDEINENFDINKYIKNIGIKPSIQLISCAVSHRKIIDSHFTNCDESLLILEDDAIVNTTLEELYTLCNLFEKSRFDLLLIGMSKIKKIDEEHHFYVNPILNEIKINNKLYIGERFKLTSSGAVAYIVKKSAYTKINKNKTKLWYVSDEWEIIASEYNLKIASTSRLLFTEDFENLESTLANNYIQTNSMFPYINNKIKIYLKKIYRKILINIMILKLNFEKILQIICTSYLEK